jgi:hypothetical protein
MQSDNDDVLAGWARMAEFAKAEGFKVSKSSIQKRGSPAVNTGPELIGYFGHLPTSTKGLMRKWLRAQVRPEPPASKRWERNAVVASTKGAAR